MRVRATLFSSKLEQLYGYNLDGVPAIMAHIARDKARAALAGRELKSPALLETGVSYMVPWFLGLTDEIAVQGSVRRAETW